MSGIKAIVSLMMVAVAAGFVFVWFGVFNVSASDKHWGITTEFLELVRNRSISSRSRNLTVPDLADSARVKRGAANYAAMCAQCHLAPGIDTSELSQGLNPKPPVLYKDADFAEKPAETFWVVKNGIKMTGMPAWGLNNSDEQIWDMIATIKAMDKMTAEQYQKLVNAGKHTHKDGGHAEMGAHAETAAHGETGMHTETGGHHQSSGHDHHDDGHTH